MRVYRKMRIHGKSEIEIANSKIVIEVIEWEEYMQNREITFICTSI